jgi:hypothetical protein
MGTVPRTQASFTSTDCAPAAHGIHQMTHMRLKVRMDENKNFIKYSNKNIYLKLSSQSGMLMTGLVFALRQCATRRTKRRGFS